MAKSPQQIAANWASKMAQAGANTTAGVQGVTQAPGQAAAAAVGAWQAGTAAAGPKYAQNSAAVSLQSWQASMITKGIPRMASGAAAAQSKVASFHQQLQPFQQALVASLPPRGPAGSNQARMIAFSTGMQAFKKSPGM